MFHAPQGSLWRKWDFHVHTPSSVPSKFGEDWTDATWETWAAGLLAAIRSHRVSAIALADYFTVCGYQEILDRGIYDPVRHVIKSDGDEESLFVLPGIELRLSHITHENHAINVHVIFDPSRLSVDRIRDDFLSKLRLDPPQGDQELVVTEKHLWALGRANETGSPPNLDEDFSILDPGDRRGLLAKAHEKAAVPLADLTKKLDALDKTVAGGRCYLLAVAKTGHGSLAELPWEGQAANIKHNLLRDADLLFSSNPDDRAFLLGRKEGTSREQVIEWFGSVKPCVWGSDAHQVEELLHPSAGTTRRYCWIKADLSFEGLKQVLYEPDDRAIVQEEDPDQRPWTEIISRVRFASSESTGLVPPEWIALNPRLTTIIGGKSAGKSFLLYLLARTIDPVQTRQRLGDVARAYGDLEDEVGFEVEWKNGDVQTLGGAEAPPSRITYLPQNYINRLAEPDSQAELEKVILRLLKEDDGFEAAEAAMQVEVEATTKHLGSQVRRLFDLRRQIDQIAETIQDLGNEAAIEAEIERLEKELEIIRASANMTDEEAEAFSGLRADRASVNAKIQTAESRLRTIDGFRQEVQSLSQAVQADISALRSAKVGTGEDGSIDPLDDAVEALKFQTQTAFENALTSIAAERTSVENQVESGEQELKQIDGELVPYEEKLESRDRAASLEEAQRRQREALSAIQANKERLTAAEEKLQSARMAALDSYRSLHATYSSFIEEHLGPDVRAIAPDVDLVCEIRFSEESFAAQVAAGLDGRQRLDTLPPGFAPGSGDYEFRSIDEHLSTVGALLEDFTRATPNRALKLKRSYDPNDMASLILKNHFGLHLSLKHGGDELPQMSPGKRGMVLLRLLLERSDATHPILIDQPEDNLDNRTVFSDLRAGVKARKKDRQIIMVTHNANLVVATDSEAVLVAHQYGPGEQPEGATRFEYRGGSLEHTYPPNGHERIVERQGTKEHVCEILEGGEEAFVSRQRKYEFAGR